MKVPHIYNLSSLSDDLDLQELNDLRSSLVDSFTCVVAMAREGCARSLIDEGLNPSDYTLHEKIETVDYTMTYTCWPVKKEK